MQEWNIGRDNPHADSLEWSPLFSVDTLGKILDLVEDAIISVDSEQRIVVFNRGAERLFGYAAAEILGRSVEVVLPSRFVRIHGIHVVGLSRASEALGSRPERQKIFARRRNGEEFATEASIVKSQGEDGWNVTVILREFQARTSSGERRTLGRSVIAVREDDTEAPSSPDLIAGSESMRQVLKFAERVAASEASTILIEGESGVGKDVLARFIHENSRRRSNAFVAVNCAAIPETLLESELFGYEKGAFTDARNQKRGILEVASGGTVLLDEIGELPLTLQAKLLRVLEEHEFRRLGGTKDLAVDLRVITATNRDLKKAIEQGRFRLDLYYRLNAIQTTIPPLRDRQEDIIPLAQFFVALYNRKFRREIKGLAADAVWALNAHTWPGNVRELRNAIERAMLMQDGASIRATDLGISNDAPFVTTAGEESRADLPLAEVERIMLIRALTKASWNQTQASHLLRITRDSLRCKMKKFSLKQPQVSAAV